MQISLWLKCNAQNTENLKFILFKEKLFFSFNAHIMGFQNKYASFCFPVTQKKSSEHILWFLKIKSYHWRFSKRTHFMLMHLRTLCRNPNSSQTSICVLLQWFTVMPSECNDLILLGTSDIGGVILTF